MTFNVTTDMYLPLLRKHEGRQGTGDREPSPVSSVSHNFIRMVEGFERNLSFIIKQEKEMKRRGAIGERGARVQNREIEDGGSSLLFRAQSPKIFTFDDFRDKISKD